MQVLTGFAAFAGLAVAKSANAVDIQDDRKVRDKGFDLIYEARELELPQSVRDGLAQVRSNPCTHNICLDSIDLRGSPEAIQQEPLRHHITAGARGISQSEVYCQVLLSTVLPAKP